MSDLKMPNLFHSDIMLPTIQGNTSLYANTQTKQ